MLEFLALFSLLGATLADWQREEERQMPLPLEPQKFPYLAQMLKADQFWSSKGHREKRIGEALGDQAPLYFASGSSRPAHIEGLRRIGHPIGVVAGELSPAGVSGLKQLGGIQLDVFIDSGAYNEFTHTMKVAALRTKIAEMEAQLDSDQLQSSKLLGMVPEELRKDVAKLKKMVRQGTKEPDWAKVIALYADVARSLGEWTHVVAPDKIGDQAETLRRLATWREALMEGPVFYDAEIFLPLQGGELSLGEFHEAMLQVLKPEKGQLYQFVPSLPLKAAVLPIEEVMAYVSRFRPRRLHLLGFGPKRRPEQGRPGAQKLLAMIHRASPYTLVSLDSNLIAASVGKTGGPGRGPRLLEGARGILRERGATPTEAQEHAFSIAWPEMEREETERIESRGTYMTGQHGRPAGVEPVQDEYRERWVEQVERAKRKRKKKDDFGGYDNDPCARYTSYMIWAGHWGMDMANVYVGTPDAALQDECALEFVDQVRADAKAQNIPRNELLKRWRSGRQARRVPLGGGRGSDLVTPQSSRRSMAGQVAHRAARANPSAGAIRPMFSRFGGESW